MTGASGAIYAQRLLSRLDPEEHEIHLVMSRYARAVIQEELGDWRVPEGVVEHNPGSMQAPFASGSNVFDVLVIVPCSMGTVGRIAHGISDNLLLRAADVAIKERRKLILVPRETPTSLIHVRNFELLLLSGVELVPACPSFYSRPQDIPALVDTVVARVLDRMGLPCDGLPRWCGEEEYSS